MSKCMYLKMAFDNIRKNRRVYLPFLLTCIGTGAMYYILCALAASKSLKESFGGGAIRSFMELGCGLIAFFAVIFLYYTYSFLLKRRKKEIGLYTILGMEKRHVRRVLLWENLAAFAVSLAGGSLSGILLFKGVYLLLLRILHMEVTFGFEMPLEAVWRTAGLMGLTFFLIFLNTIRIIHLTKPIDMLKGGQMGEKEPKTRWGIALIGFLLLGGGYYLALATKSPLEAFLLFFVAVVMVILGTYALFTAGSILILKLLRKNKGYYYKTSHFTAVSGMLYRMKQNAAGLASICVMSTGVLILISTSVSMYFGMSDLMRTRYPRNIMANAYPVTVGEREELERELVSLVEESGLSMDNTLNFLQYGINLEQSQDNVFLGQNNAGFNGWNCQMFFLSLEDYNRMTGKDKTLEEGEVLLQETRGDILADTFSVEGHTYRIKERFDDFELGNSQLAMMTNTYYVVLKDTAALEAAAAEMEETCYEADSGRELRGCRFRMNFDADGSDEAQKAVTQELTELIREKGYEGYTEGVAESRESFFMLYGSIFFIGIFIGLLFLMATVLIIYYKQLSEGYDDHDRFVIMQKVGMSRKEVKRSIKSQVMTVFFLPLAMAAVHICFAFPLLVNILRMMNLNNVKIFAAGMLITFLVFALIYALVYGMTAKVYYRIVSWTE